MPPPGPGPPHPASPFARQAICSQVLRQLIRGHEGQHGEGPRVLAGAPAAGGAQQPAAGPALSLLLAAAATKEALHDAAGGPRSSAGPGRAQVPWARSPFLAAYEAELQRARRCACARVRTLHVNVPANGRANGRVLAAAPFARRPCLRVLPSAAHPVAPHPAAPGS